MQVVFVVLHKTELLQNLLTSLKKAGVSGGTILDSQGMISYIQESDESYILGSLRLFLEQARPDSKTMFFIINDEQTDLVFDTIDKALGGLKKHNTGIAFAMPITKVAGVVKDDSLFESNRKHQTPWRFFKRQYQRFKNNLCWFLDR